MRVQKKKSLRASVKTVGKHWIRFEYITVGFTPKWYFLSFLSEYDRGARHSTNGKRLLNLLLPWIDPMFAVSLHRWSKDWDQIVVYFVSHKIDVIRDVFSNQRFYNILTIKNESLKEESYSSSTIFDSLFESLEISSSTPRNHNQSRMKRGLN